MKRALSEAAHELQLCAAGWEPDAKLLGNVSALEVECLMNELATSKRDLAAARTEMERVREECRRRQMTNYDRAEAFNRIQDILHPLTPRP